jgi:hypothetical protein
MAPILIGPSGMSAPAPASPVASVESLPAPVDADELASVDAVESALESSESDPHALTSSVSARAPAHATRNLFVDFTCSPLVML